MLITELRSLSEASALLCKILQLAGMIKVVLAACSASSIPELVEGSIPSTTSRGGTRSFARFNDNFMQLRKHSLAGCENVLAALPEFFQHSNLLQFRNFSLRL